MYTRSINRIIISAIALLLVASSCAHPISKQLRNEAQKDNMQFTAVLVDPAAYKGRIVLWGGEDYRDHEYERCYGDDRA